MMNQKLFFHYNESLPKPKFFIDPSSIGYILDDLGYIGSGFVVASKRLVITSAHNLYNSEGVISYSTASDVEGKNVNTYELEPVKILEGYDLALLKSQEDICNHPFPIASNFDSNFGERIFYYGFDKKNNLQQQYNKNKEGLPQGRHIHESKIDRFGTTSNDNGAHLANFIDYYGYCVPGFSGGVTINEKGEAIAVNTFSWVTHGFRDVETDLLKNDNTLVLNQAFSIHPLCQIIDEWQQNAVK